MPGTKPSMPTRRKAAPTAAAAFWTAVPRAVSAPERRFPAVVMWSVPVLGEVGAVDPAVEAHAGHPTEHRTGEAGEGGQDEGDDPGRGQISLGDRYAREAVELREDVVLAAHA